MEDAISAPRFAANPKLSESCSEEPPLAQLAYPGGRDYGRFTLASGEPFCSTKVSVDSCEEVSVGIKHLHQPMMVSAPPVVA